MRTADRGHDVTGGRGQPDTNALVAVHQMFRSEIRTSSELVSTTSPGDPSQVDRLRGHLGLVLGFLQHHRVAMDALLWPLLKARSAVEVDLLELMAGQQSELDGMVAEVRAAIGGWTKTAHDRSRDLVALRLSQLGEVLDVHLDAEELLVLPRVREHLSVPEWDGIAAHEAAQTPRPFTSALVLLGTVLEDAGPVERLSYWATVPPTAQLAWQSVGQAYFMGYRRSLGFPTTSAAAGHGSSWPWVSRVEDVDAATS